MHTLQTAHTHMATQGLLPLHLLRVPGICGRAELQELHEKVEVPLLFIWGEEKLGYWLRLLQGHRL